MKKQSLIVLLLGLVSFSLTGQTQNPSPEGIRIPIKGNVFVTSGKPPRQISEAGTSNWFDASRIYSVFFRVSRTGNLDLSMKYTSGEADKIKVVCCGKNFHLKLKAGTDREMAIGSVAVKDTGYVRVDFIGVERKSDSFPDITELFVKGEVALGKMNFVSNDFGSYWAHRGPSVHLNYSLPKDEMIEWFYNEITVPSEGGPVGTYYMSNGFAEGYFGMQINSLTERKVLFSVWSPFKTDDPNAIPESHKIKLLRKGEGVRTGEFGNEGAGGQSYLVYPWQNGLTYRFLTRIKPDGKGSTEYTSYFYATDESRWRLIASFSRPQTDTYYQRPHSFLESFDPETGYLSRKAYYGNQWACTVSGKWIELTKNVKFTTDDTGRKGARLDFKGGVEGDRFFLQNCGFLNDYTAPGKLFDRPATGRQPEIDFGKLP